MAISEGMDQKGDEKILKVGLAVERLPGEPARIAVRSF
jgi:hypothetical protein